jgi:hypothetical protein
MVLLCTQLSVSFSSLVGEIRKAVRTCFISQNKADSFWRNDVSHLVTRPSRTFNNFAFLWTIEYVWLDRQHAKLVTCQAFGFS